MLGGKREWSKTAVRSRRVLLMTGTFGGQFQGHTHAYAENVRITLPEPMSGKPIVINDDGLGMTDKEVRQEYLAIASDRRKRRGSDRTFLKNRPVKGRKGIGKFAGFVTAEIMEINTKSHGKHTRLRISKDALLKSSRDLEQIDLRVLVASGAADLYATHLRDWRVCYEIRLPCGTEGSKVGRYATPYRTEVLRANF